MVKNMTFYDRLQKLPEEERVEEIKRVVTEGTQTEFGEWVLTHFQDFLADVKRAVLLAEEPIVALRAVTSLQCVELLKSQIFEGAIDD